MSTEHSAAAEPYGTCDLCGRPIPFGAAMVTLDRNVAEAESTPEYPDGELEVLDSEEMFVLCARCGGVVTADIVSTAVNTLLDEMKARLDHPQGALGDSVGQNGGA